MSIKLDEETIKKILMDEDQDFNKLITDHQHCELQLKLLDEKKYLTDEEKIKQVQIKKVKLGIKDKIYQRIRLYQQEQRNQSN